LKRKRLQAKIQANQIKKKEENKKEEEKEEGRRREKRSQPTKVSMINMQAKLWDWDESIEKKIKVEFQINPT